MADTAYAQLTAAKHLMTLALTSATVKALLLKDTYTYDASDEYVSDLTPASNEVSGGSYARQTITLAGESIASNIAYEGITGNITWTAVPGTIQYIVTYIEGTGDSDSPIIGIIKKATAVVIGGNNYQITMARLIEGIVTTA